MSREEPRSTPLFAIVMRIAALLRGGLPESRVWHMVSVEFPEHPELALLAECAQHGDSRLELLRQMESQEWRLLAVVWALAERSGAPFAPVLERLADALESLTQVAAKRSVLLAGPRSTVRLVTWLPAVALIAGLLLGFNPLPVLLSPLGAVLAAGGVGLLWAGSRWSKGLIHRVESADWVAGWACELTWVALRGGASPQAVLLRVVDEVCAARAEWVKLTDLASNGAAAMALRAAERSGVSVGALLLAEAAAARDRARAELERDAERLAVRVLLPLGVCVLPSFVLLGVIPVLLAVMGSAFGADS